MNNCKQCNNHCKNKFCSRFCFNEYNYQNNPDYWFKKDHIPSNKNKKLKQFIKDPMKLANVRNTQFKKGQHFSFDTEFKKDNIIGANTRFEKGQHFSPNTEFKIGQVSLENHPNWQGGISFEPYGTEFNKELKEQIRARDSYRCQECFRHQSELRNKSNKYYKLNVHHIDFNKKNNKPNNLISLCKPCHIQTNYNRQDWVEYFQEKLKSSSNI